MVPRGGMLLQALKMNEAVILDVQYVVAYLWQIGIALLGVRVRMPPRPETSG